PGRPAGHRRARRLVEALRRPGRRGGGEDQRCVPQGAGGEGRRPELWAHGRPPPGREAGTVARRSAPGLRHLVVVPPKPYSRSSMNTENRLLAGLCALIASAPLAASAQTASASSSSNPTQYEEYVQVT